jgi:hypothetical protein
MGAAADYLAVDPFKTGAQTRGSILGAMSSYMPTMPMSSMAGTAQMMEQMQRTGFASVPELSGLMGQGVMGGQISTRSATGFQQDFQRLIQETKQVASVLNSSLNEAYAAMQQIKGMGVSNVAGTAMSMRGLGAAAGMSPEETSAIAMGGAQLAKMAGISRDTGVAGALTSAAVFSRVGKSGAFGGDFGVQDLSAFQNAGYRFFGSGYGQQTLAAMMTEDGALDSNIASQIAGGTMSGEEIRRRGSRNLARNRDVFASQSQSLVATFMSEFGPQGIANPLMEMTRGSSMSQTMRAQLTGLNSEQLGQLGAMSNMDPAIKQGVLSAAREGFQQGSKGLGLADSLSMAMQKMTAPIRDKFAALGAQVAQAATEAVDDITGDFVSRPARGGDPYLSNRLLSASALNQRDVVANIQNFMNGAPPISASGMINQQPGFLASVLPQGLSAIPNGASMDSLAYGGMLPQYQGLGRALGGVAAGAGIGAAAMGAGNLASHLGRGAMAWAKGVPTGTLGGAGTISGTARMGGALLRGAGALTTGALTAASGALAIGSAAYTGIQIGEAINYNLLNVGAAPGALVGSEAETLKYLDRIGAVKLEEFDPTLANSKGVYERSKQKWTSHKDDLRIVGGTEQLTNSEEFTTGASGKDHMAYWGGAVAAAPITMGGSLVAAAANQIWGPGAAAMGGVRRDATATRTVKGVTEKDWQRSLDLYGNQELYNNAMSKYAALTAEDKQTARSQAGSGQAITVGGFTAEEQVHLAAEYGSLNMSSAYSTDGLKARRKQFVEKNALFSGKETLVDQAVMAAVGSGANLSTVHGRGAVAAQLAKSGVVGYAEAERIADSLAGDKGGGDYLGLLQRQSHDAHKARTKALQGEAAAYYATNQDFIRHVATSSGVDSADMMSFFSSTGSKDVSEWTKMAGSAAAGYYDKYSAEQLNSMSRMLSSSESAPAQMLGAKLGLEARFKGRDERFGVSKGKGNKWTDDVRWLEDLTGVSGLSKDREMAEYFKSGGERGGISSTMRAKMEQSLTAQYTTMGVSVEDATRTASFVVANSWKASRGETGAMKAIRDATNSLPISAKANKSDGENSMLMKRFEQNVDRASAALERLAAASGAPGGTSPAPATMTMK